MRKWCGFWGAVAAEVRLRRSPFASVVGDDVDVSGEMAKRTAVKIPRPTAGQQFSNLLGQICSVCLRVCVSTLCEFLHTFHPSACLSLPLSSSRISVSFSISLGPFTSFLPKIKILLVFNLRRLYRPFLLLRCFPFFRLFFLVYLTCTSTVICPLTKNFVRLLIRIFFKTFLCSIFFFSW